MGLYDHQVESQLPQSEELARRDNGAQVGWRGRACPLVARAGVRPGCGSRTGTVTWVQ